jgi:hypothetical protein
MASFALVALPAAALAAGNPSGTGPPSQSCQDIEAAGGTTPGHSASSPGSPFNEPGINSQNGGTGGQHYSAAHRDASARIWSKASAENTTQSARQFHGAGRMCPDTPLLRQLRVELAWMEAACPVQRDRSGA